MTRQPRLRPDQLDAEQEQVEAAGLRLTWALLDGNVDDPTWQACVPPLDPGAVFELTTLVGYYSTLALQMRVLRADGPEHADERSRRATGLE